MLNNPIFKKIVEYIKENGISLTNIILLVIVLIKIKSTYS